MTGRYADEDRALRRAEVILADKGVWPGVVRHQDGSADLTFDPSGTSTEG